MGDLGRRDFLKTTGAAGAALALGATARRAPAAAAGEPFKLKYAPHFGMFQASAGPDPVDQLRHARDLGFTAWEDNGMKGRSPEEQERIAQAMTDLGMTMGVFVAHGNFGATDFTNPSDDQREGVLNAIRQSVEVAKRVNATWTTVVPGAYDNRLPYEYQLANTVEMLKRCAEIYEPEGLVMVLEPLNWWRDHPGLFLTSIPQAYLICEAVDSPACKILDDLYHQQITEGNLIPNIDRAWKHIAYFQQGDNPGRNEPGTGEINYQNVFRHIHAKGFEGICGMEHGMSRGQTLEGEAALVAAYRWADGFEG